MLGIETVLNGNTRCVVNLSGSDVRWVRAPSLSSAKRTTQRDFIFFFANEEQAFFHDVWCEKTLPIHGDHQFEHYTTTRDASHDAEYRSAHRVLFVPDAPEPELPLMVTVNNKTVEFRCVFVGEAQGVYIQHHRRWVPPNVLVFFPLRYTHTIFKPDPDLHDNLGTKSRVVMDVETLGVIYSPYEVPVSDHVDASHDGATLMFSGDTQDLVDLFNYKGPSTDAYEVLSGYDDPPWGRDVPRKQTTVAQLSDDEIGESPPIRTNSTSTAVVPAHNKRRRAITDDDE